MTNHYYNNSTCHRNNNNNNGLSAIRNNNKNIVDMEDVIATLHVMRRQEESGYHHRVNDYFQTGTTINKQHCSSSMMLPLPLPATCCASSSPPSAAIVTVVDMDCRFKMVEWCYQVIDFCHFQRNTVSIAMSYMDRFLSIPSMGRDALQDRRMFQLVAMTCLYTAVKLHEPQAVDPQTFAGLSRGLCTAEEIQAMESIILDALEWRMNPPTAMTFLHYYMQVLLLLTNEDDDDDNDDSMDNISIMMNVSQLRDTILDLAKFQIELAVREYALITVPASTIAFGALLNAMECIDESMARHATVKLVASNAAYWIMDDIESSPVLHQTQQQLYELIVNTSKRPSSAGNRLITAMVVAAAAAGKATTTTTMTTTTTARTTQVVSNHQPHHTVAAPPAKNRIAVHHVSPRSIVGQQQQQQQQQQQPQNQQ